MPAIDNLNSGQFDMTSKIKNKPNAQGTLFTPDKSARTPESRQPKGYSPERYQAVGEATGMSRKNGSMHVYGGHAETQARAWASLARSTVPVEHLKRPDTSKPASEKNPSLNIGVRNHEKGDPSGHYQAPGTTAMKHQGRIALFKGAAADDTVIHEIGHHVDRDRSSPADRNQVIPHAGSQEGFADRYAAEHMRTAGYKKKKVDIPSRPGDWTGSPGYAPHGDSYEQHRFKSGYNKERHGNSQGPIQPLQFKSELPKEHVKGQLPLLQKQMDTSGNNAQWRY
jgi:hypothetical protein